MRRKCFFIVLIIIISTYFLVSFGVKFNFNEKFFYSLCENDHEYVLSIVKHKESQDKVSFYAKIKEIDGKRVNVKGLVLLNRYDKDIDIMDFMYKDIRVNLQFNIPDERRNPNCFNYKNYLRSKNTFIYKTLKSYEILNTNNTILEKFNRFLLSKRVEFIKHVEGDYRGIIIGVLFGDTSCIDDETYNSFKDNGTSHILAISGLHISIIYSLIEKLFNTKNKKYKYLAILIIFYCYGTLCMWSVSISRAMIMIILKNICYEFDLRYDRLTSISITAFILYIFNPYVILGSSFQLSFLAVLSIAIFPKLLKEKVPKILNQSISVTIGITFFESFVFNYIPLFSILVNAPVIFLANYLVPLSLMFFITFSILGSGVLLNKVLNLISILLVKSNNLFFNIPKGFNVSSNISNILLVLSLFLFLFTSEEMYILFKRKNKKKIFKYVISLTLIIFLFFFVNFSPITYDDVVFIDVGQGDSIHIRDENKNVLIDGGGNENSNIGELTLKPYLLKNGVKKIDLTLLTHLHTDHYKGILELSRIYKIKNIYKDNIKGDNFKISNDLYIKTLWPIDKNVSKDENKNCSVFMVYYKGIKILITGDLDIDGEKEMLKIYKNGELKCDILKVGHHGSKTSTSDEFLKETSPKYFVIQVGKNNIYGHPNVETLYKISEYGGIILRNDINGAIGFRVRNGKLIYHKMME